MDIAEKLYQELIRKVYQRGSLDSNDKTKNSKLLMRAELFARVDTRSDPCLTEQLVELVHDIEWAARRARTVRVKRNRALSIDIDVLAEQENELLGAALTMIHQALGDEGYKSLYDESFSKNDVHVAFARSDSSDENAQWINGLNTWNDIIGKMNSQISLDDSIYAH